MPSLKERLEAERHEAALERDELNEQIKILDWFIRHVGQLPNDAILKALDGGKKKAASKPKPTKKRNPPMKPEQRQAQILAMVSEHIGPVSVQQLAQQAGVTAGVVRDNLKILIDEGVVRHGPERVNPTGRNSLTYERVPMAVGNAPNNTVGD